MTNQQENIQFLSTIYQNAKSGMDGIKQIVDKTTDPRLKTDLYDFLSRYKAITQDASSQLSYMDADPTPENLLGEIPMKAGTAIGTMMDSSDTHLASMTMRGSVMGTINSLREIGEHPHADTSVKQLAAELARVSQECAEAMKRHL